MGNRRQGQPRRTRKRQVTERFGEVLVMVDLDTGDFAALARADAYARITPEDRDKATGWVLRQLHALKVDADPLEVRDALWK